jgi:hypothetical protein
MINKVILILVLFVSIAARAEVYNCVAQQPSVGPASFGLLLDNLGASIDSQSFKAFGDYSQETSSDGEQVVEMHSKVFPNNEQDILIENLSSNLVIQPNGDLIGTINYDSTRWIVPHIDKVHCSQ